MTVQVPEELTYAGRKLEMSSEPLGDYFDLAGIRPGFIGFCSTCWRGYIGQWEILDERLYLTGISGPLADGTDATLEAFFPGFGKRVFAHWFSGQICASEGELLNIDIGLYERDLLLDIEKGILRSSTVRENGGPNEPGVTASSQ